jgi:hypothetical protein
MAIITLLISCKQQQLTKAELITDEVSKNATVDAIKQIFSYRQFAQW